MKEIKLTSFWYMGRLVVGIRPITKIQWWKAYGFMMAWVAAALYVIVRNAVCDCVYLTVATATPVVMVTIFVFLWTYFIKKDVLRSNYIYGDK